jgi:hypothetical protein
MKQYLQVLQHILDNGVESDDRTGLYELPVLALLSDADKNFILKFVKYSGSLKEMASDLKLSYPTVRNMLNEIISKIADYENK